MIFNLKEMSEKLGLEITTSKAIKKADYINIKDWETLSFGGNDNFAFGMSVDEIENIVFGLSWKEAEIYAKEIKSWKEDDKPYVEAEWFDDLYGEFRKQVDSTIKSLK